MNDILPMLMVTLPFIVLIPLAVFFVIRLNRRKLPAPRGPTISIWSVLDPRWLQSGLAAVVFYFVYLYSGFLLRHYALQDVLKLGVGLLPVPVLVWLLVTWSREIRRGDELERRIQLEAVGFAFPMFMVFMMGSVLLDRIVGDYPYRDMWAFLPSDYWAGLLFAKMRYMSKGDTP